MTSDSYRSIKKNGPSKLAQSLFVISELKPGLTMVVGLYGEISHYVYAVIIRELRTCSIRLPVPMPDCEIIACLHSGPTRKLEQLQSVHKTLGISELEGEKFKSVYRVASTALDWTNPAAVSSLLQKRELKENGCIVLQLPDGTIPDFEGLLQLRQAAEKNKSRFLLFCPGLVHEAKYCALSNEFFVVNPCNPNPGFNEAFVLSCPELSSPVNPASGKVLCCSRLGNDGFEIEITPYVAEDPKTRLMAILKANEWSLDRIGKTVNLDKSNVSRKLRNLSTTVPKGWNEDMLAQWLDACDLGPIDEQHDGDGSASDCDPGDVEVWDDDLDSLDTAKSVAPDSRNGRNTRNKGAVAKHKRR